MMACMRSDILCKCIYLVMYYSHNANTMTMATRSLFKHTFSHYDMNLVTITHTHTHTHTHTLPLSLSSPSDKLVRDNLLELCTSLMSRISLSCFMEHLD